MSNECLFLLELAIEFSLVLVLYKFWGRVGLFAWICIVTVLANIQVVKTVEIFGFVSTLGNPAYSSLFLASDILNERYSRRSASLAVALGFLAMALMTGVMFLTLQYAPMSPQDGVQQGLISLFGFLPRIVLGSFLAYIVSQTCDVQCFDRIRRHFPSTKYLWLRNNASTMISQTLDTLIFCFIAFWGLHEGAVFWDIVLTTFLFKIVGALLDTPFMYMAKCITPMRRVHPFHS